MINSTSTSNVSANPIDTAAQWTPAVIAVAPNGAYKTSRDHTALPLSDKALAQTALDCSRNGANMIHFHVRDDQQVQSLDSRRYLRATEAIKKAVEDKMLLQITTEAAGIYQPEQQIECIKAVKPEAVSMALRELVPSKAHRAPFHELNDWMLANHVLPQFILYDTNDIHHYADLITQQIIPAKHSVLLVLGRYSSQQQANPQELIQMLNTLLQYDAEVPWMVCAFGRLESACTNAALSLGGHARIGFENNLHLANGKTAENNAQLIEQASKQLSQIYRPLSETPYSELGGSRAT